MMILKQTARILIAGALCCSVVLVNAQVRVRKSASDFTRNPTLTFQGVKNSLPLSAAMNSMLKACGWFDIRSGGETDYILSGSYASSGQFALALKQRGVAVTRFTLNFSGAGERDMAKTAVDVILKKIFNIQGICRTRIAFCADTGKNSKNIYSCDIDGSNLKRITNSSNMCVEPEWMPDGKSLLYTRYNRASTDIIQTIPANGLSRIIAAYKGMNLGASASPDGKYIALILSRDGLVDLYVKSLTTRARRRLTKNRDPEASPCWGPSGTSICYASGSSGRPQLYIIPVSSRIPKHLTTFGSEAVNPSWSSDNQIAYSARIGGQYVIAALDLEGKKPGKVVVRAAGDWESPSWAPDNRHIVCYRTYKGQSAVYLVDTWTGRARQMVSLRVDSSMPAWSNIIK